MSAYYNLESIVPALADVVRSMALIDGGIMLVPNFRRVSWGNSRTPSSGSDTIHIGSVEVREYGFEIVF